MNYLLTGGSGFIGSHLTEVLLAEGHNVTILDNFTTGNISNLSEVKSNALLKIIQGDIRDESLIKDLCSKVDRVIHLAAAVGVFNIMNNTSSSILTNVIGTEVVLHACLKFDRPIFLLSSSEIYGKNSQQYLDEDCDRVIGAPHKLRWSYADSKALDESLAFALHKESGLEIRIARLFNTVGPRQRGEYGMVIPRFIKASLHDEPIHIYGDGSQTRCFVHVSDVVNAIVQLDQNQKSVGKAVNIGNDEEISILNLAKLIIKKTDSRSEIIFENYEKIYGTGYEDMVRRVPDLKRIRDLIGWQPTFTVDGIIDSILDIEPTR